MAEPVISIEADDVFGLVGSFIAQSATKSLSYLSGKMLKHNGDYQLFSTPFNLREDVTVVYIFNSPTGLGGELPKAGAVYGGYIVDNIEVLTKFGEYF